MSDTGHEQEREQEETDGSLDASATPSRRLSRGWRIALAAFIVAAGAGIATGIVANLFGDDDSLRAIPADAHLTITVDLQTLNEGDRFDRMIAAFAEPLEAAGHIDDAEIDLLALIDESLQTELGLTYEEDISPWAGSSASLALWIQGELASEPDVLVSVLVEDRAGAESFVERLLSEAEGSSGVEVATSPLEGGTLYSAPDDERGQIWIGDDLLLVALDVETITAGLEAWAGESITSAPEYQQVIENLPDSRFMDLYVSSRLIDEIALQSGELGLDSTSLGVFDNLSGTAVGITLDDAGLRFDGAQVISDGSPIGEPFEGFDIVEALPDDTFGYLGFSLPDDFVENLLGPIIEEDPAGFDEISTGFEEMFGLDLFEELLPALGPDMLVAILESSGGMIAAEVGAPLGVLFVTQVSDVDPVGKLIDGLEDILLSEGMQLSGSDPVVVSFGGEEVAAYHLSEHSLAMATSGGVLSGFTSGSGGITDSELYRELDGILPGDGLNAYFDLGAIFDELPIPADERAILAPLRGFGASSTRLGDLNRSSALVIVDY